MASSASCLFQTGCHYRHRFLARWTTTILILLPMFYLIGPINGAVDPKVELGSANSVRKGLNAEKDAKAIPTGLGKVNGLDSTGGETGLRGGDPPRAHVDSNPAKVHPSRPFGEDAENTKQNQVPPAQGNAGQSRPQAEADRRQEDMKAPKHAPVPNDQDDIFAPLRGVNFNNEEAYQSFILDYRARLVQKMDKQGPDAEKWLNELKVPQDVLQRIRGEWNNIKSAALSDYKLIHRGRIYGTLLRWCQFIFRHSRWREERLHLQFLKIRMAAASAGSNHLREVIELDLARKGSFTLSKEELKLIEHTANVGGDIEKLTPEERQLIKELPSKTLMHRRRTKIADLIQHFSTLQKGEEDSKVSEVILGLKALDKRAVMGTGWSKEETKLVMTLGKIKDKKKIDRNLNDFQKALLKTLVNKDKKEEPLRPEGSGLKQDGVAQSSSNNEKAEQPGTSTTSGTSDPQPASQEAKDKKDANTNAASETHEHNNPSSRNAKDMKEPLGKQPAAKK